MRFLPLALLLACTLAVAKPPHKPPSAPKDDQLIERGHYTNKAGQDVHAPAHTKTGAAPKGASAKCGDGSFSFSKSHRGTCSRHGGVAQWLS